MAVVMSNWELTGVLRDAYVVTFTDTGLWYEEPHKKHVYTQFPERLGRWSGDEFYARRCEWLPGVPERSVLLDREPAPAELLCMRSIYHDGEAVRVYCRSPAGHAGAHRGVVGPGHTLHWHG
jgi:hypothetical protein